MLHAGGAPAFLYCGPRPCAAALERCACRKAAGRACPAPTFYAGERFTPPRGVFRCHRRARSGQDRSLQTTRYRCIAGRDDRLSKKVCSPLGPLCEGAPPAGGGGENCTAVRNISGYGKVLSLRPFGAPPSQREVFRHAVPPSRGEGFLIFASEASTPPYCCRACRCIRRAGSRQGPRRRGPRQEPGLRFQTRPRRTRRPWAGRGPRS